MNLSAANTYLRISAKHKPEMLKAAGSNLNVAGYTHGLFGVFAEALKGNESCMEFLDRQVEVAAKGPSELMLQALADMSVEAHIIHAAPEEPPTPVAESPVEIIPGVYA